jgi:hypothetical protein
MIMSDKARNSCIALVVLPLAALGHDIYVWQETGNPFAFAALGWITKTYLPDYHKAAVEMLSPENFNMLLTPVLEQKAFFLGLGIEVFAVVAGIVSAQMDRISDRNREKARRLSYNRK